MLVLGIDPGTRVTGYGAVDRDGDGFSCVEFGALRPDRRAGFPDRLLALHDAMDGLVRRLAPDAVAVEDCFYANDPRAMVKLGHVKGLVLVVAARSGVAVSEYAPRRVKQSIVGAGGATKEQVRFVVERTVAGLAGSDGTSPKLPFDVTDAIAIALCHHHAAHLTRAGLAFR